MAARALLFAFATLASVPGALALDVFPDEASFGATEARILVRVPSGGTLSVDAVPGVAVAVGPPGATPPEVHPTPWSGPVAVGRPEDSWHGLPGTVEIVARRSSPLAAVRVTVDDGSGSGAEFEWPPVAEGAWLPAPALPVVLAAVGAGAGLARRKRKPSCLRASP